MRMRLGKTLVAIRRFNEYEPLDAARGHRFLVVAPSSALGAWEQELTKEGETSICYLEGPRSARKALLRENYKWFLLNNGGWLTVPEVAGVGRCPWCSGAGRVSKIVDTDVFLFTDEGTGQEEEATLGCVIGLENNVATVLTDEDELLELKLPLAYRCPKCFGSGHIPLARPMIRWDAVVLDESTFVKNPKARVTNFFLRNFRDVPHRWILTGEPTPEGDLDVWCQFAFLDGHAFGQQSFWQWRAKHFVPGVGNWGWIMQTKIEKRFRAAIAKRAFVLDHKDVGMHVSRIRQLRELTLPSEVRKAYRTTEREFILEWKGEEVARTMFTVAKWHWLRQLCSGFVGDKLVWDGKFQELSSLVRGELRREQVVIWFAYNRELHAAERILRKAKVGAATIVGGTSPETRRNTIERFRGGWFRALLVQGAVDRGLRGADLSSSDTTIYFSNHASREIRAQSEDRTVHMDKRGSLLYLDLVAKDTVDVDVTALLNDKRIRSESGFRRAVTMRMEARVGA